MSKIIIDICLFCSYTKSRAVKNAFALTKPKSGGFSCQDHFPPSPGFFPIQKGEADTPVILTVDEYETIRLMDLEGLSQQECSQWMEVARTTVQRIYENARKKLALALVEGRPLRIGGGDYRLCDGQESCGHDECFKRTYHQQYEKKKGADTMRIAVAYENGQIFQHFGHTEQFKIYDAEGGAVRQSEIVDTNGRGHGALAGILHALNADVLICGGIGQGAKDAGSSRNQTVRRRIRQCRRSGFLLFKWNALFPARRYMQPSQRAPRRRPYLRRARLRRT